MEIFGWIVLVLLALFAVGMLVIFALPFVISEVKMLGYKIKRACEDKKLDADKRSEEKRNRDAIKRQKDFELANKKLDGKLQKLDKQIKVLDEKQAIVRELRKTTTAQKEELNQKPISAIEKFETNTQKKTVVPTVEPLDEQVTAETIE